MTAAAPPGGPGVLPASPSLRPCPLRWGPDCDGRSGVREGLARCAAPRPRCRPRGYRLEPGPREGGAHAVPRPEATKPLVQPQAAQPRHRRGLAPKGTEGSARSLGDSRLEIGPRRRSYRSGGGQGRARQGGRLRAGSGAAQSVSPQTAQPGGRGAGSALQRPARQRAPEGAPDLCARTREPAGPVVARARCDVLAKPPTTHRYAPPLTACPACARVRLGNSYCRGLETSGGLMRAEPTSAPRPKEAYVAGEGAVRALDAHPPTATPARLEAAASAQLHKPACHPCAATSAPRQPQTAEVGGAGVGPSPGGFPLSIPLLSPTGLGNAGPGELKPAQHSPLCSHPGTTGVS